MAKIDRKINNSNSMIFIRIFVSVFSAIILLFCLGFIYKIGSDIMGVIDKIFVAGIIIVVFFLVFSLVMTMQSIDVDYSKYKLINIKQFVECRESWKLGHVIFMYIHFLLIGISLYSSIIALYINTKQDSVVSITFYIVLSIILSIIDCLVNPSKIAEGYRMAFETLDKPLNDYLNNLCNEKEVIIAKQESEKKISIKMP